MEQQQPANPPVEDECTPSSSNEPESVAVSAELPANLDKLSLSPTSDRKEKSKTLGDRLKSEICALVKKKDDEKDNSERSDNRVHFSDSDLIPIKKIMKLAEDESINLFAAHFGKTIVHPVVCSDLSPQEFERLVQLMIKLEKEAIFNYQDSLERDNSVHLAIKKNIILLPETIDALAKKCRVDFSRRNKYEDNVLHLASKKQSFEMLQGIVKYYRGDWNAKNKGGNTAVHNAARHGNSEILQYLVSLEGVDVNVTNDLDETALVHLFYAPVDSFTTNLNILVNAGADINAVDYRGRSLLFHAVFNGRSSEVAQELVRLGCKYQCTDNIKHNILHICLEKNNFELLEYFVRLGVSVNHQEISLGRSPLHVAAVKRNMNAFECLVSNGGDVNLKDGYGKTPLSLILKAKDCKLSVKVSQILIKYGIKIDGRINNIQQLLTLVLAAKEGMSSEEIKKIVDLVVDLSLVNEKGQSLLHYMATTGNAELVKHLISKGIDVNKTDFEGRTPLHVYFASTNNLKKPVDFDVVDVLVSHGADVPATDALGLNALFIAAKSGREWKDLERLLFLGAEWNLTDFFGNSILHVLAREGNVKAIEYFLSFGANVNAVNYLNETPLHLVKDAPENFIETVTLLQQSGADIEAVDFSGQNAFHAAMIARRSATELSFLRELYENNE